jgi:AraC-like DNA-binding protein
MQNQEYMRFSGSQFQTGDLDRLYLGSGEWLQLTPGIFECRASRVAQPALRITELHINCGVQLRHSVEPWRLLILLVRPAIDCQILTNGKKHADGCCLVVSGEELSINILGAASIFWFDIDRRALGGSDRNGSLGPVKCTLPAGAVEWVTLASYAAEALADERAGRNGDGTDGGTIDNEIGRIARSMLHRARSHVESQADVNREKLVRTALELMWSSIEEPRTLREICTAAKCSVRTLIYVFNATFGMSPMRYFKIQRLNFAHRRLQRADSGARIFDVAADCGFWHLGHFGVDYKAFFGTTPRMTPRSRPGASFQSQGAEENLLLGSIA